jgi:chemotaxis protein MotB
MSKKKHPEHVNHERWLVSYADFITLLFAFFVVLFASSQSDKKKQTKLAEAMQNAFTPMAAFEAHSKTPALTDSGGISASTTPVPIQPPLPTVDEAAATQVREIQEHLSKALATQPTATQLPEGSITMHTTDQGLVISLHDAGFFDSGSAEVRPEALPTLERIAASLPTGQLRIEGHTDNLPIHTAQFASNWELSTTRASRIARLLLEYSNTSPADLSASGYAEFHPVASNATPAGRLQNRRVDIILLRHPTPSQ